MVVRGERVNDGCNGKLDGRITSLDPLLSHLSSEQQSKIVCGIKFSKFDHVQARHLMLKYKPRNIKPHHQSNNHVQSKWVSYSCVYASSRQALSWAEGTSRKHRSAARGVLINTLETGRGGYQWQLLQLLHPFDVSRSEAPRLDETRPESRRQL